jgi:hypothetical protein
VFLLIGVSLSVASAQETPASGEPAKMIFWLSIFSIWVT